MLFVITGKTKGGSTGKERIARRVDWQYPAGMRLVAEYWLMNTEAALMAVVEADDAASVLRAIVDWDDVFDLTVVPAMTAEQGLALARQMQTGSSA
jgi:hypothetical protein